MEAQGSLKALAVAAAVLLASPICLAGDGLSKMAPSHYLTVYTGKSHTVFGTTEVRDSLGFAYGHGKEDRQLRYRSIPAQLVHSVHFMRGRGERSPRMANSVGYEAVARYRFPTAGPVGTYLDLGWGLYYTARLSPDVNSHFNSTPMFGFGVAFKQPAGELLVGLNLLHVSNGGTVPPNSGQNYFNLTITWRYD